MNYFPENVSLNDAITLQEEYSQKLIHTDEVSMDLKKVGGVVLYSRGDIVSVGVVILNFPDFSVDQKAVVTQKVLYPSIPTCEGFREGKVLVDVLNQFEFPDVYFIDGHGLNHPRRFGIVSHVGLALGMPTIAVSRELMCGSVRTEMGRNLVIDENEIIAEVVSSKPGAVPFYVSPGNKVSLDTAVMLTKKVMTGIVPEPIRLAHAELQLKLKEQLNQ